MDIFSLWGGGVGLPETVALAAVAVIGYVFGRRSDGEALAGRPQELVRAAEVARQLESVAAGLRTELAAHRAKVERFQKILRTADGDAVATTLQNEAERVLEPTLRLVGQVANAYDQIRRQSRALSDFSGGRTDELTGLCNRRALSELLGVELSGHLASGGTFSIAVLGLETTDASAKASRDARKERVLLAAELLRPQLREHDFLARYGLDEFVVVMPNTRLFGASRFGRRVRGSLADAGLTVSCGLAQSQPEDTAASLLGRADSALYSAKATAVGEQFLHNGATIRNDTPLSDQPDAESPTLATA